MTKDADKLKLPPDLVEGLKRLALPRFEHEQLTLPPHLKRFFSGRSVPRQVLRDVVGWFVAHAHDGDPQVVRQVRVWLDEQQLDPLLAAELKRVAATTRQTDKRDVLHSIMRELAPAPGVSTYKLVGQIKPLWAEAWRRMFKSDPPQMPTKETVAAARRTLNSPRRIKPRR